MVLVLIRPRPAAAQVKPGDHAIWLYFKKRSFVVGYGVRRIPGEVVRVCKRRIRLKVRLPDRENLVNVSPDNAIGEEES